MSQEPPSQPPLGYYPAAPKSGMTTGAKIALGVIIGSCVVMGGCFACATLIWDNAKRNLNANSAVSSTGSSITSPTQPLRNQPDDYSQFLATARLVLRSDASELDLSSASVNLISIPSSATEYKEAQQLLPQVQKKLREARERAGVPTRTAWQYSESEDEMTSQKMKTAAVVSSNTVELAFPYGGEQHATLILRRQRGSDNVILRIEKGQLTCGDYNGRSVSVRFDEKPPRRFGVSEAADHSSTKVFINNEKAFIAEAKKAKRIRIEAIVYQNGSPVFEFDTGGLEW